MATTTTTTARCAGTSSTQTWSGRRPTGRCARPVGFAVMGYGRHGGHTSPELVCQAHLGGLVARLVGQRHANAPGVTVAPVTPSGTCPHCGERPDWHEPGAACPPPL